MAHAYFRTKSIDKLLASAELPEHRLRKSLGPWSLTALGIGAIVGAGIFVLTGTAAAGESLQVHDIFKAPLLEVLLHGRYALGASGRPGAGSAIALFFLKDTVTTEIYTLSLHDALPTARRSSTARASPRPP